MHNRRSWMMGLPNCVSSSGPAGGPGPGRCQRPGLQVTVTVTASGPGPDGFRSHVVAYTRRCAERRRTSYSMPPPTVTAPTGCQPPGPASGVARPSGRPRQPDPKFDSSRWLLRPGPGRATIPHEPGRRHGDQRTFKRNIEYKTDDGTECQLVHTLAHAIVYIVSVDELTFATKTDDDTECQLVHTLAHGIFCGYVSAAFSVAVEE